MLKEMKINPDDTRVVAFTLHFITNGYLTPEEYHAKANAA